MPQKRSVGTLKFYSEFGSDILCKIICYNY